MHKGCQDGRVILSSLVDHVRLELGDTPKSFRYQFDGDGVTTRWELPYSPLDASTVVVSVNGVDVSNDVAVEEPTGVMEFDTAPAVGFPVVVEGVYFRYFTTEELETLCTTAIHEHLHNRTSGVGQQITLENLPLVEEGPLVILVVVKALYVLATDASFDIDIHTPDGVSIPRSDRYRQLMMMIDSRRQQYMELCNALNIGVSRIEVYTLRRISDRTNKYVPIYRPQEIDDNSKPQRVWLEIPGYGGTPIPSAVTEYALTFTQGDSFRQVFDFNIDITGATITAQARTYPESPTLAAQFSVTVQDAAQGLVVLELTPAQTKILPLRAYWDMQMDLGGTVTTVMKGQVFCEREVTHV